MAEITLLAPNYIKVTYSPYLASVIYAKITNTDPLTTKIKKYYELYQGKGTTKLKDYLVYWSTFGKCKDFKGNSFQGAVDEWDEKEKAYSITWNLPRKLGNTYLRGIVITPLNRVYMISAKSNNIYFSSDL